MMAISVNLTDPARVAGFVNPGSEVAIFVTSDKLPSPALSRLLLSRVQVLGVGASSTITSTKVNEDGEQTTGQLPKSLLTLALHQKASEKAKICVSNGDQQSGERG